MLKTKFFIFTLLFVCIYTGNVTAIALYRERVITQPRYLYDYDTHHYVHVHQIALQQQEQYALQQAERRRQFLLEQERLRQLQFQQLHLQQQLLRNTQTKSVSESQARAPQAVVQQRYARSERREEAPALAPVYPVQPQRSVSYTSGHDSPVSVTPDPLPKIETPEKNEKSHPHVIHEKKSTNQWKISIIFSLITLVLLYLGYQYCYEQTPVAAVNN